MTDTATFQYGAVTVDEVEAPRAMYERRYGALCDKNRPVKDDAALIRRTDHGSPLPGVSRR